MLRLPPDVGGQLDRASIALSEHDIFSNKENMKNYDNYEYEE